MNNPIDGAVAVLLNQRLCDLEQVLSADVLAFYGGMYVDYVPAFMEIVEQLFEDSANNTVNKPLFIILTTPGGDPKLVMDFIIKNNRSVFIHTRKFL